MTFSTRITTFSSLTALVLLGNACQPSVSVHLGAPEATPAQGTSTTTQERPTTFASDRRAADQAAPARSFPLGTSGGPPNLDAPELPGGNATPAAVTPTSFDAERVERLFTVFDRSMHRWADRMEKWAERNAAATRPRPAPRTPPEARRPGPGELGGTGSGASPPEGYPTHGAPPRVPAVPAVAAPPVRDLPKLTSAEGPGDGRSVVLLFTLAHCGACRSAKAHLEGRRVAYRELDLDTKEGRDALVVSLARAKRVHGGSVPVLDADGEVVEGFSPSAFDGALARAGFGLSASPRPAVARPTTGRSFWAGLW